MVWGPTNLSPESCLIRNYKRLGDCYINAQCCQSKTLAISDHILENYVDIMALCETWLNPSTDAFVRKDLTPTGYAIKHTPSQ